MLRARSEARWGRVKRGCTGRGADCEEGSDDTVKKTEVREEAGSRHRETLKEESVILFLFGKTFPAAGRVQTGCREEEKVPPFSRQEMRFLVQSDSVEVGR